MWDFGEAMIRRTATIILMLSTLSACLAWRDSYRVQLITQPPDVGAVDWGDWSVHFHRGTAGDSGKHRTGSTIFAVSEDQILQVENKWGVLTMDWIKSTNRRREYVRHDARLGSLQLRGETIGLYATAQSLTRSPFDVQPDAYFDRYLLALPWWLVCTMFFTYAAVVFVLPARRRKRRQSKQGPSRDTASGEDGGDMTPKHGDEAQA